MVLFFWFNTFEEMSFYLACIYSNFSCWNLEFFSISDLFFGTNQDFMPFIQAQFFVAQYPQKLHSVIVLETETSLSYIRMLNLKSIVTKNYFWLIDCWINPSHFLIHNIMPNDMQKSFHHATLDLAQKSINLHFFLRNSRKTINANLTHDKKSVTNQFYSLLWIKLWLTAALLICLIRANTTSLLNRTSPH